MVLTRIKCLLCGTSYKSKFCSSLHKYVHQQNSKLSAQFQCTSCGKRFMKFAGFKSHLQFHGYSNSFQTSASASQGHNLFTFTILQKLRRLKKIKASNKLWKCRQCGKKFRSSRFLKIHYLLIHKVHDLVTHNQSQKEYTQNCHPKLNGHLLYKEELSFSCNKYTERSVNEGLLTQYSQVPMEQTRSVQNEYWKQFFQNRTLQMHKSMHTKIEQPLCTEYRNGFDQRQNDPKDCFIQTGGLPFVHDRCGERFYEKESLFSGTECSQRFTQKEHLTEHSRMHTKEQRFVCNVCGKRFKYRYILEHHRLMHSGERPYVCRECGKGYTSKQNLIKHTRVHTGERPFACDQCEKKFMQKEHLMGHKRTHSEERPFVCSNCGKGFARNLSLQRHCLIHSEKRLFVCDQCGKGFNRKYILERHRKQLHIKEEHVLSKTPL